MQEAIPAFGFQKGPAISKIYLLLVTKALLSKVILIELNKYGLQLVGWLGVGLAHWWLNAFYSSPETQKGVKAVIVEGAFLTVPPKFQCWKEKCCSTNEDHLYIKNFMEQNLWLATHPFSFWYWKLGGTVKKAPCICANLFPTLSNSRSKGLFTLILGVLRNFFRRFNAHFSFLSVFLVLMLLRMKVCSC